MHEILGGRAALNLPSRACRIRARTSSDARATASLRTRNLDFGGFDSSIILIQRGVILMPIGDFPELLSQRILAGVILVGSSSRFFIFRGGTPRSTGNLRRNIYVYIYIICIHIHTYVYVLCTICYTIIVMYMYCI